jgi:hypothetical protein
MDVHTPVAPVKDVAPSSIVEGALGRIVRLATPKVGLETPVKFIELLQAGDRDMRRAFRHELAREAAVYLGTLDKNVKAVYMAEYDASPEDVDFEQEGRLTPVNLIVWVTRKTAALDAAVTALDRALVESYDEQISPEHPKFLVDAQMVDDHDVANRKGYGAMLTSIHMPPLELWRAH